MGKDILYHLRLNLFCTKYITPNGSGKTTAINCILALLKFDKGSVKVFGEEIRPESYHLKKQIGVVMQNVAVFEELSVYENIDYFC